MLKRSRMSSLNQFLSVSGALLLIVIVGFFIYRIAADKKLVGESLRLDASTAQSVVVFQVDPTKNVNKFEDGMRGVALVNWDHSWGKPFAGDVPGLTQALQALRPGVIRYAGGLWANSVGFDRTIQKTPYTAWTKNGQTYYFHYGTDEIASLSKLAKQTNSNVLMQVNIANNDPSMWADMVKYVNKEQGLNFKYWELGNELDHDTGKGVDAAEYGRRLKTYQQAMLTADSSIEIHGAAAAFGVNQNDANSVLSGFMTIPSEAARAAGKDLGALTWHWYQQCNTAGMADVLRYTWDSSVPDTSWRNGYVRKWSALMPTRVQNEALASYPTVKQGVTELNVDACNYDSVYNGNHIGALWFADVLGRLAYNGVDYATAYTGYGEQAYSLLYPVNGQLNARPTYYTYLMYSQYFGDQMVSSISPREDVSLWASKDSRDSSSLKVMAINMSATSVASQIQTGSFSSGSGLAYTLSSNNPTDSSTASMTSQSSTSINGVKIDAMNVASGLSQIKGNTVAVNGNSFTYTLPAYSVTAFVLKSGVAGSPPVVTTNSMSPTPKASPTISTIPSAIAIPTRTPTPLPTKSPTPVPTLTPLPTNLSTPIATLTPRSTPIVSSTTGNGLNASYFADRSLSSLSFQRIDTRVAFNWGYSSPIKGRTDRFSVRWSGYIVPPASGKYTFYTKSDDGVRLWVNNSQIINNWSDHALYTNQGTIELIQNMRYPVKLEYYENRGQSEISLDWSSSGLPREIIPSRVLFSQ